MNDVSKRLLREALYDVMDRRPWRFHEGEEGDGPAWTEDQASQERMKFADQVLERFEELRALARGGESQ